MNINLEQAKRLWELGVRRKASKAWYLEDIRDIWRLGKYHQYKEGTYVARCSAYNAEELISMMQGDYEIRLNADKTVDITVWYERYKGYDYFKGNTLTEALCNKLIYDIENGIITPEEINK